MGHLQCILGRGVPTSCPLLGAVHVGLEPGRLCLHTYSVHDLPAYITCRPSDGRAARSKTNSRLEPVKCQRELSPGQLRWVVGCCGGALLSNLDLLIFLFLGAKHPTNSHLQQPTLSVEAQLFFFSVLNHPRSAPPILARNTTTHNLPIRLRRLRSAMR